MRCAAKQEGGYYRALRMVLVLVILRLWSSAFLAANGALLSLVLVGIRGYGWGWHNPETAAFRNQLEECR
jgi:hypothetical protein